MKILLSLLCLWSLSSPVSAQGLDVSGKRAYDALARVPVFAVGGIGVAGTRSAGESAFRVLLKQKGAGVAFQQLLKGATPEGKMYGLLGLSLVAPRHLAPQAKPFLTATEPVHTISGCIPMTEKMSDLAQSINKGTYRPYFARTAGKPLPPTKGR